MDGNSVEIPALLGRYRPISIIGHGGMSTVYRARDELLGREVAIKMMRGGGDTELERYRTEVRLLAGLAHHGIVSLIDAGIDDSDPAERHPFLVMELVEGTTLAETMRARELSPREIGEIGYDLAEALEFVHARGVVHRDISPTNVMLVAYGTTSTRARARLTDFGIALDGGGGPSAEDGVTTGTAAYLSPEQAGQADVTAASDVYSLGLVLLECFTRRLAFPGAAVESAMARLAGDPEVPDDLPDDWTAILRGMLARDPHRRPLAAELTLAFRQEVIAASGRHKQDQDGEVAEPSSSAL